MDKFEHKPGAENRKSQGEDCTHHSTDTRKKQSPENRKKQSPENRNPMSNY